MELNTRKAQVDVVVIGGGIVGLWLSNLLKNKGFTFALLERSGIGGRQSLCSQGIIHGGTKYALKGELNSAAAKIAQMPQIWQRCMQGQGDLDLRDVKVLSLHHYLWSFGKYTGAIKSFIGQKVLNSESQVLKKAEMPAFFKTLPTFQGSLCALNEVVLDVPSLIRTLVRPIADSCLQVPEDMTLTTAGDEVVVTWSQVKTQYELTGKYGVLCAGSGNAALLEQCAWQVPMQLRPLQMVWLKFPDYRPKAHIFVHCVDKGTKPRLTITSHQATDGNTVWYLGGDLAEEGALQNEADLVAKAKRELQTFFPTVDFSQVTWGCEYVQRAEHAEPGQKRPDSFFADTRTNLAVAWPTKLAFAPAISEEILGKVCQKIAPTCPQAAFEDWQKAGLNLPPWEKV